MESPQNTRSISLKEFRQLIDTHFSMSGLKRLCFDLGIDFDHLQGDEKNTKIIALIKRVYRNGRLDDLLISLGEDKPNVNWPIRDELPNSLFADFINSNSLFLTKFGLVLLIIVLVSIGLFLLFQINSPDSTPTPTQVAVIPPTDFPPTNEPTATPLPPTSTDEPSPTPVPPPPTHTVTDTPVPPADTATPSTETPIIPTDIPARTTDTATPSTETPIIPTDTVIPSTETPIIPTDTATPLTETPIPLTDTPVPPAAIPTQTSTSIPIATPTNEPTLTPNPSVTPTSNLMCDVGSQGWEFNVQGDTGGWRNGINPSGFIKNIEATGSTLKAEITGENSDPYFEEVILDPAIDSTIIKIIDIQYRIIAPGQSMAQLFWTHTGAGGGGIGGGKNVDFPIIATGALQRTAIKLTGHPHWISTITAIRFDPVMVGNAGYTVEIDFIRFCSP